MKKHLTMLLIIFGTVLAHALSFTNLTDDNHISGDKLTKNDLNGRVIVVENWGNRCGPCIRALPHMADLADKYKKDKRIVIIGSHVWKRDDKLCKQLLKTNKCKYPVYQDFSIDGAHRSGGVPFAYIFNHKGKCVWQGHPSSKDFDQTIKNTLKGVPNPDTKETLVSDMEIKYHKNLAKQLVVGQNIEPILKQLEMLAKRKDSSGEEAEEILNKCLEWVISMEAEIEETLQTLPSKALVDTQTIVKTVPHHAVALKAKLAPYGKDIATGKLATSRTNFAKLAKMKVTTPNARKQAISQAKMYLTQLNALKLPEDNADYADVKAMWEDFIKQMNEAE